MAHTFFCSLPADLSALIVGASTRKVNRRTSSLNYYRMAA